MLLLLPQIESFAQLGRLIHQKELTNFAEDITEKSILSDLQEVLEEQAGRLTRLYDVSLDGDIFTGKAEKRISLGKTEAYTFTISPSRVYYKPIMTADLAEYLNSDQGWAEIVEYVGTAQQKAGRAAKNLNCKPENYQCGGKCQSRSRGCPSNPTAGQKAKVEEALGKAKNEMGKPKNKAKDDSSGTQESTSKSPRTARENIGTHKDVPSADPSAIKVKGEKEFKSYSFKKNGDTYEYFETRKMGGSEEVRPISASDYKAVIKNEFSGSWQKAKFGKDFLSETQQQEYDKKYKEAQKKQVEAVSQLSTLSEDEAVKVIASIKNFSEDGYTEIRNAERGVFAEALSEEQKQELNNKVESINKFIKTAPTFKGDIHRGMNFRSKEDLDNFLGSIAEGGLELNAMSSFSSKASVAKEFAEVAGSFASGEGGDYGAIITVKGNRSGVSIKNLSVSPEEDEVLVPKGVKYRVASVSGSGKLRKIELEEINE